MRDAGLLGMCVPKEHGGLGAGYRAYMTTAAEIGRYCGATALTYNMHVCSCLWTGPLSDDLDMSEEDRAEHQRRRAIHYARIVKDGAIYAQPFSEGGGAAAGVAPFSTWPSASTAAGSSTARRSSPRCRARPTTTASCAARSKPGQPPSRRDTMYIAVPAKAAGRRRWSATGTRSACAAPSRARSSSRTCSSTTTRR